MRNEARFALRTLRRNPGFTAIAVCSLALGIGANTAIFSLVDRVLLRSLPVEEPQRLVLLHNEIQGSGLSSKDNDHSVYSYPMYTELRDETRGIFSGVIARARWSVTLGWQGSSERSSVEIVSGNYFDVLGVRAARGRTFTAAEAMKPDSQPVAVLTWPYFRRRFGSDPKVIGSSVEMNGRLMTVLGVTGPEFTGVMPGSVPDLLIPVTMQRAAIPAWDGLTARDIRWLNVFARLAPGVSIQQAEARIQPVWKPALERDLNTGRPRTPRVRERYLDQRLQLLPAMQGINQMANRWRTSLIALMCMVGLVLLIACVNVANLMIARAAARTREFAIRVSVGGSLWDIVKQLLIESLLIALLAGSLGIIVATWTSDALLKLIDRSDDSYFAFRLDLRMLLFTLLVSTSTAILFGLAPAFDSMRINLAESLKAHAASVAGGSRRLRKWMVAGQVALATVLLVAAALFGRSFYALTTLDPGFRPEQLTVFAIDPTMSGYDTPRVLRFYDELTRKLQAIPGVRSVAAANPGPFTDSGRGTNISIAGYKAREDEDMNVGQRAVTPGYFRTMGTPILAGREFTERDGRDAPKVVVVNQTFVRRFLPNKNPLGVRMAWGAGDVKYELEIVGVAGDNKHNQLRESAPPAVFFPNVQEERVGGVSFFVRADRDPSNEIREAVRQLDPRVPVAQLRAMQISVQESVNTERLIAGIATAFGALATLLAAIGVYGVIAYSVVRRTTEIGIRIALGADRSSILGIVMSEIALVAAVGLVSGLALSLALGRFVRSQLFGIQPNDPATVASAAIVLLAAALAAAYVPARRASRIDPMRALRFD